ncbi:MAG: GHKL domain-containing protein [Ruminococcus sp.]|nr:GHKL domain-containing protein [Ruminococcus sp.]
MSVLWETFEIAVNFFQGFMLTYFPYSYLSDKQKKPFFKSSGVMYAIALGTAISIMNRITVFEHFYALIYIAITFIYAYIHLNGSPLKKIFSAFFPNLIMSASTVFILNFSSVLFGVPAEEILSNNSFERYLSVISAQILITCLMILSLKLLKMNSDRSDLAAAEWILISIVIIISIFICVFLNFTAFEIVSPGGRTYILIAFTGIILINAAVCYLAADLGKKNAAVRENEILKLQREYNSQYIANANTEYDLIKKLRHDFKDNYRVIYTLLSEGKTDKAMEYIKNNIDIMSQTEIFVRTNNDIVNAVINAQLSAARSFGIDSACLSVTDFEGIDDTDLCRLLSNMLENAVTACVNCKKDKRQIYLKISYDGCSYIFSLKNTIGAPVIANNKELRSTKAAGGEHGYGTKIIRDIAEKYSGRCDFYEEDDLFCCCVVLRKK